MKRYSFLTLSVFILLLFHSCESNHTYYEQFSKDKSFSSRIDDLNKSINEIRAQEKGKRIKDDVDLLKFVYEIGGNDTYIVTYLFDEKGCFEIGIDGYFEKEEDANNVIDGIKKEMMASPYGTGKDDNHLCRWTNTNKSVSVELDYRDTARGLFIATIFANE
jgi:hypothetical protein